MPKTLLFLIILFCFIITGFVAIFFINKNIILIPTNNFLKAPLTPTPATLNHLSFSPATMAITPGQKNTVEIVITSQKPETNPSLIQLEIAYDPNAISDVSIEPGNFFTNPTTVLRLISQKTGRISYALETLGEIPTKTSGTVAIMSFIPNSSFPGQQSALQFLPKTKIKGKSESNSLTKLSGTTLIFQTPQASTSAVPTF